MTDDVGSALSLLSLAGCVTAGSRKPAVFISPGSAKASPTKAQKKAP